MKIVGLTSAQVAASRKKYGTNTVPGVKPRTAWQFFLEMFRDKINLILLGMLVLFLLLAVFGFGGYIESVCVGLVLLCVGLIGTLTKLKAQKYSLDLKHRTAVRFVMVLRNGKVKRIKTDDIVVGDVVFLQSGETVPGDGYILSGRINVNNAVLNGESEECPKEPIPGFKYNPNKNRPITVGRGLKLIMPYCLIIGATWILLIIGWYLINLPIGPGVYPTI